MSPDKSSRAFNRIRKLDARVYTYNNNLNKHFHVETTRTATKHNPTCVYIIGLNIYYYIIFICHNT